MKFKVVFQTEAAKELENLRSVHRSAILAAVEKILTSTPTVESRSKIKKLRQPAPASYRLRVGDYRVFYDVEGVRVTVLKVLHKEDTFEYLEVSQDDDKDS
ncbi:MAG TPA: type II toxin-antitoxin system RelE/ParE family toxin [Planctomycetota bacterium]|nr:type II toxin-antitoxin system RelE/ParE family toxin [Planctomycetota bacterium]